MIRVDFLLIPLLKPHLTHRRLQFFRKIRKREGPHIVVQGQVAHHPVAVHSQLVGDPPHRLAGAQGDQEHDVLEYGGQLDEKMDNAEDHQKQDGVQQPDENPGP